MTIKELRTEKGLSRADFAKALGISVASISAYETGKTRVTAKAMEKIKAVYGVDLAAPEAVPEVIPEPAPAKKPRAKKTPAAPKAPAPKAQPAPEAKPARLVIQSPMGGEITPEEILAKVGPVDSVYVRVDQNAAYWVRGEETGAINLW